MLNLLASDFMRVRKSKLFRFCMIFMAVFALVMIWQESRLNQADEKQFEHIMLNFLLPTVFAMAAFSSLSLGTDYSDGAMRNKIIVGHSRVQLYFSKLIVNIVVAWMMCIVYLFVTFAIGLPCLGAPVTGGKALFWVFLGCFVLVAAVCSLFTLVGILCTNKAISTIINILVIGVILLTVASYLQAQLHEPEFYTEFHSMVNGETETKLVPNPKYIKGSLRVLYQFLSDFLPMGQVLHYMNFELTPLWLKPLYSLLILVASTGIGVLVFRKKDLK